MVRSLAFFAALAAVSFVAQDASAQRVRIRTSPSLAAPAVPGVGIHAGHHHHGGTHAGHHHHGGTHAGHHHHGGTHAGHHHHGGFSGNSLSLSFGYGFPYRSYYYSPGYSYYGGYGYGYGYNDPYGIYYNPGANYLDYYLPPIYAPAELAYGPQAMQRFAGPPAVDPFGGIPGGLGGGVVTRRPAEEKPADARPTVRVSNLEARRRALRFVEAGDELFRAQRYHEALQKYKSAAEAAPDVAEAYMRQGHALTATSRYELAAAAFKRGLALGPEWAKSDFLLSSIYGGADLAKDTHVENLATALLAKPADADLIFVLAMFLHFDGDTERAARFFKRAGELAGEGAPHLAPFLEGKAAPREPDAAPPKKPLPPAEAAGIEV